MQQRRREIVEFVNSLGTVSFSQIRQQFPDVSEMTLRTDLKILDEERRLVRVHGGAKSVEVVVGTDDFLGRRTHRSAAQKERIAQKALTLLRPDTTVYLDSGSTIDALARILPDDRFQIFTNSISCAGELFRLSRARVFMPGGFVNRYSQSLCGVQAVQAVSRVNFDLALLGATGFAEKTGFSCGMEEEAQLKRAVLERAEQTYVLMDSDKVGLRSAFSFATLDELAGIVSDGGEELVSVCKQRGVLVL